MKESSVDCVFFRSSLYYANLVVERFAGRWLGLRFTSKRSTAIFQRPHDAHPGSASSENLLRKCNGVGVRKASEHFMAPSRVHYSTSTVTHATTLLNHSLAYNRGLSWGEGRYQIENE
jgi:hypothetical protein